MVNFKSPKLRPIPILGLLTFSACLAAPCFAAQSAGLHETIISNANIKVSGIVLDENGNPIIGASVAVHGSKMGTITDMDGKFSFNLSSG